MNETMKAFLEHLNQNSALKEELDALAKAYSGQEQTDQVKNETIGKTIKIAAQYGFALTAKDFPSASAPLNERRRTTWTQKKKQAVTSAR